jgi:nicotinamidase-related amidase
VILSTINPRNNGQFFPEIAALFPDQEAFSRKILSFDAFEDEATWEATKKTGKRKIVVSGLWTSMCFAYTALHALREGLEVYGLMDGVIPITLEALVSEWMHDWGNPKAADLVKDVYSKYGAMVGLR